MSEVVTECAAITHQAVARTEAARAGVEVAREGIEAARRRQEEAVARQEAATTRIEEADARWRAQTEEYREWNKRQEKALQELIRRTDEVVAELRDGRDERRAMLEALFKVMDRLPPPPPNLRSA
ncbi:MAG TPA: hypothetical protein VD761_04420 [Solirubrobacterales bacterium]|nr:hypothetical protein [Solirubrobacterales bacterium]